MKDPKKITLGGKFVDERPYHVLYIKWGDMPFTPEFSDHDLNVVKQERLDSYLGYEYKILKERG
tara:strand:- start:102 stop:293 length:192 start_codon:yes stop_codon:yes gene_type:complete